MPQEEVRISLLPAADALTGSELIAVVQGGVTKKSNINAVVAKSSAVSVLAFDGGVKTLTVDQNRAVLVNPDAVTKTQYSAPNTSSAIQYQIINLANAGASFTANGTDTIRIGDQVSAAGGTIQTTDIGATLGLIKINGVWVCTIATATWTLN